MKILKVTVLSLLFLSIPAYAQTKPNAGTNVKPVPNPTSSTDDDLSRHLSAAQTFQLTGDMPQAAIENQMVVAIALQRAGFQALEDEDFKNARAYLSDSAAMREDSLTRASLAVAYMRLNDIDKALVEARTAVALDPRNVRAYQILGSLYYSRADYQNALPALEKVIEIAPDFDAAYLLGIVYLNLKQTERAKLLFEEIQNTVNRNSISLHMMFGRAYEETDHPLDAEREYRTAIAADPKQAKANFYLGFVILQNGGSERLLDAAKAFEQELTINPLDFYSLFFLGVVYSSLDDHPKAVDYLKRAAAINSTKGETFLFLGQSQVETGDLAGAEKNLRRAIELTKDASAEDFQVSRAHFILGRLLIQSGRKEEGDKELARSKTVSGQRYERDRNEIGKILGNVVEKSGDPARIDPAKTTKVAITPQRAAEAAAAKARLADILAQAYNNLGVIAVSQGNLNEAVNRFSAAAKWKPDLPGVDRNAGIVRFRMSQFDQAAGPLSRQLKLDPKDDLVRKMLGVSYYFTKNYKAAVSTLKPIEAAIAADVELTYFYGISLIQAQLNKDAEIIFGRLADANATNSQARYFAAEGFVLLGDFERALKEFRLASQLEPQMKKAHYGAGQSLIRLNRLDDAEKEFRLELALDPYDALSKYHIAFTLMERKTGVDEAVALLAEAIASKPDYSDAHYQLGKYLVEKGDIVNAIEHLERAAQIDPSKDYVHYQLSIAYRRAERAADAERELKVYRDLKAAVRNVKAPMGGQ